MFTVPTLDAGQAHVDAAMFNAVFGGESVDQALDRLSKIEPAIIQLWGRGETHVKPVHLMTADDLVQ